MWANQPESYRKKITQDSFLSSLFRGADPSHFTAVYDAWQHQVHMYSEYWYPCFRHGGWGVLSCIINVLVRKIFPTGAASTLTQQTRRGSSQQIRTTELGTRLFHIFFVIPFAFIIFPEGSLHPGPRRRNPNPLLRGSSKSLTRINSLRMQKFNISSTPVPFKKNQKWAGTKFDAPVVECHNAVDLVG